MKKDKMERNRKFYLVEIVSLVVAVAIAFTTVQFYRTLQNQLFSERQSHLTEMTIKITEVINVTVNSMQEKTESVKSYLQQTTVTKEDITGVMATMSDILSAGDGVLYGLDDQGTYYSSEGARGLWTDMEDLTQENNAPVIRDLVIYGQRKSCLVFIDKLDESILLDDQGTELVQIAYALPIDNIQEFLTVSMFGDECYTYMVNQLGRRLYKQTFDKDFIEDLNVISALQGSDFIHGGTAQDLEECVSLGEYFCGEFTYEPDDENYFISTVPVEGTDWTVLVFVPTEVLGVQTNEFLTSTFRYFLVVAIAALIIFGCMFYIFSTSRNDQKMLRQQIENAKLLEKAAEEARNANAAKSEFLAHMSHDIRTPINGIIGMTNMALKNKQDQDKVQECLDKISDSSDHLLTLVNDVLDMSAIERGKVTIAHEPMNMVDFIDDCMSIIDGQLVGRKITFVKEYDNLPHPFVYGDELHMRQIFINILGNAVKFTPDGGTITFRAQEISGYGEQVTYQFEFEDTGIGIREEFQEKIFEAFSQESDNSRTHYHGTGLGMAITKKYLDLMGGDITVKSRLGEGSCFTVTVPLDIAHDYKMEQPEEAPVDLTGMRVLLVEDNELNMEIANDILTDEGIIVSEAENGQLGVEAFEASEPGGLDAILMDIMMPVMNGHEATRAIRASSHPDAKTIPIIAMTANAYQEDVEKALAAGMNAHIAKPIDIDLLLSVLGEYRKKS
jgi:signal transduction histidine kinase